MPHCIVEYSPQLTSQQSIQSMLSSVQAAAQNCGLFEPSHVKTRGICCTDYILGSQHKHFIHVRVHLLKGRTEAQKMAMNESIAHGLSALNLADCIITVEAVDIDTAHYVKVE